MPTKFHGRFTKRIIWPLPVAPEPDPTGTRTVENILYTTGRLPPLRTDGKYADWGMHDLQPGFTHTYDWAHGARPGVPGPMWPASYNGTDGWDHHNAWFEAIPAEGGMPGAHRNCRLQIVMSGVHHRSAATGTWTAVRSADQFATINGGYWNGDKNLGGYNKVVDWPSTTPNSYWRQETIGQSIDLLPTVNTDGTVKTSQCIAHGFWPGAFGGLAGSGNERKSLSGGDHYSIFGWVRLISDSGSVDLSQARYVGRMSGDAFLESTGSNTLPDGRVVNPPLVQNRLLRLTGAWQATGVVSGWPDEDLMRSILSNHPLRNESPPAA